MGDGGGGVSGRWGRRGEWEVGKEGLVGGGEGGVSGRWEGGEGE